jgi:hypothetical protein
MNVRVTVTANLNPTEDEAKVRRALLNIFPEGKPVRVNRPDGFDLMRVEGSGMSFLETFRRLLKQDRIRDTARRLLLARIGGEGITIYLHKQAAFAGHASFCAPVGESPQGPITVRIETPSPELVIDYLTARQGQEGFQRSRET